MKKILLSSSVLMLLLSTKVSATHIVGGELSYQYIGNDQYFFTLKTYRDCINGLPPADNPAYIGVYDGNGNLVNDPAIMVLALNTIPVSNTCAIFVPNICVEEATYEFTLTLPGIPGGYIVTYQRCCRSSIIENIADPLNVGMSVFAIVPDPSLAVGNSSPVFNNYPPMVFCVNIPINFDHSATDPDGDVIYYELCDGVAGADAINPQPLPAGPPPYFPVPYLAPYSGSYPFDTYPAFAIDPNTGLVTGTPTAVGVFSFAVCAEEFRNGNFLGAHRREMVQVFSISGAPVGIDENGNDIIVSVFPNPASDELLIDLGNKNVINELQIVDLSGKILKVEKINVAIGNQHAVSLHDLANGNYFLQLIGESILQSVPFVVAR